MTCRECENAPTRLCVACYEREQYGEQWQYVPRSIAEWRRWAKEWAFKRMREAYEG